MSWLEHGSRNSDVSVPLAAGSSLGVGVLSRSKSAADRSPSLEASEIGGVRAVFPLCCGNCSARTAYLQWATVEAEQAGEEAGAVGVGSTTKTATVAVVGAAAAAAAAAVAAAAAAAAAEVEPVNITATDTAEEDVVAVVAVAPADGVANDQLLRRGTSLVLLRRAAVRLRTLLLGLEAAART